MGKVWGTLKGSAVGPLWAAQIGSNASDNIYYNAGSGNGWTRNAPHGCNDSGGTPCSNSGTEFRDVFAVSATDVWVVGSSGWILRYDGKKWSRLTNKFSYQSYHDITAVFGDAKEKLVTLATGSYGSGGTYQVSLVNYNIGQNRWFGPTAIQSGSAYGTTNRIFDIAGDGYAEVWMVGRRRSGSGGSAKTMGWVVKVDQ